jgi:hypothetical protein
LAGILKALDMVTAVDTLNDPVDAEWPRYLGFNDTSPAPTNEFPLTVLILLPDTNVACLLLNVLQSVELNAPLVNADAVGMLN